MTRKGQFIFYIARRRALLFPVAEKVIKNAIIFFYHQVICVMAIITGIVSIDKKLTSATVLDAVAVSLP